MKVRYLKDSTSDSYFYVLAESDHESDYDISHLKRAIISVFRYAVEDNFDLDLTKNEYTLKCQMNIDIANTVTPSQSLSDHIAIAVTDSDGESLSTIELYGYKYRMP